jgi:DNA-directed RNA polymerase II subunit RPB9
MSSPAPSHEGDTAQKPLEQITFRFCSECSNMLYPKEDEADRKLLFTCRTCSYSEEASSSCIFRNVLNNAAGETAGVTQDVGSDPTVGASSSDHAPAIHACSAASPLPSAYVWCACCGKPIICGVCHVRFATTPRTESASHNQNTDEQSTDDALNALSWSPSDDDFSDFMGDVEDRFQEFGMEDEDEMLGGDSFNHSKYATKTEDNLQISLAT